ncbi:MAG: hypothetical protein CL847_02080 [Crocinitomicaceae bacterium]|nr:hypothetical protein [Crocinitomicaceae bacterium]
MLSQKAKYAFRCLTIIVEKDSMTGLIKFNILLHCSDPQIHSYINSYSLLTNKLYRKDYLSICCELYKWLFNLMSNQEQVARGGKTRHKSTDYIKYNCRLAL